MKIQRDLLCWFILLVFLSSCTPIQTPVTPIASISISNVPTSISPTNTIAPTATNILIPTATTTHTPTPIPGTEVFSLDSVQHEIPWLPIDKNAIPGVAFVGFRVNRAPFNNPLVRQAFAAAIDRQVITEMALKYYTENARPATSLTPPEVLGRDLYNEIGMGFDPELAKSLFIQAGYEDSSAFPETTFIVNSTGETAPGARLNMVKKMVEMWKDYLGVNVGIEVIYYSTEYYNLLKETHGEMYWLAWVADFNDPDNFLHGVFSTDSEYNYGKYTNTKFNSLVNDAAVSISPEKRQNLYFEAETLLCQEDAALIPLYHYTFR